MVGILCAFEISYAYLKSVIDDSVVACDQIINAAANSYDDLSETVSMNSNNKKET